MNINKPHLSALVAIGAALAMPMAFAQTAPTPTDPAAAQSQPPQTQADQMQSGQAPQAAQPQQVTWADLDTDKDGSLSKEEVASVPELNQVFDQADADGDGKLTAEEYQAFAAKTAGGSASGN